MRFFEKLVVAYFFGPPCTLIIVDRIRNLRTRNFHCTTNYNSIWGIKMRRINSINVAHNVFLSVGGPGKSVLAEIQSDVLSSPPPTHAATSSMVCCFALARCPHMSMARCLLLQVPGATAAHM